MLSDGRSIKKLRPYLGGYKFTVLTDHSALRWLCNLKEPTGRLARWALQLQQWDFDIVHRRRTLHQVPDLKMLLEVEKFPAKFQQWRVEEGRLIDTNQTRC